MYWRTWKIVEGFASAQQRENPKVQAKPVAQRKPCVEFEIGQPIGFSKVHGISPVSCQECSRKWRTAYKYSYIPCKAPDKALPCRVTSSAAREAKELASGPHSGWYKSATANLGAIKCFTIVSLIEVERYYDGVAICK